MFVGIKLVQDGYAETRELTIEPGIGDGWNQKGIVKALQPAVYQREKRLESNVDVQYLEHVNRK